MGGRVRPGERRRRGREDEATRPMPTIGQLVRNASPRFVFREGTGVVTTFLLPAAEPHLDGHSLALRQGEHAPLFVHPLLDRHLRFAVGSDALSHSITRQH